MKINYIFRSKKTPFFSIEKLFGTVISELNKKYEVQSFHVPEANAKLKSVIKNLVYCKKLLKNDGIFHITGDVRYLALVLPRRRTILSIMDLVSVERLTGIRKRLFKFFWYTLPIRKAGKIVTISEKILLDLKRMYPKYKEKMFCIPVALDKGFAYTPKEFDSTKPVVLQIGTTENKNLIRSAEALRTVNCRYRIIGRLSSEQIEVLRKNKPDYENVYSLSDEEIIKEYEKSDLVLFPSLYEGFGMPIVEAQRTGRVVITSNLSPMKDVASDGAILVDPYSVDEINKAVVRLMSDSKLREDLIKKGLFNSEKYSISEIIKQYERLYEEYF